MLVRHLLHACLEEIVFLDDVSMRWILWMEKSHFFFRPRSVSTSRDLAGTKAGWVGGLPRVHLWEWGEDLGLVVKHVG